MPGGAPPLDLSALLPYVATALAIAAGVVALLRKAVSRYLAVEAPFGPAEAAAAMSIGRAEEDAEEGMRCRVCGSASSKVCTACKSVRYCSPDCQRKHWNEHKLKCRKKVSGSAIALIPGHVSPTRGAHKMLKKPRKILFPYDEFVKLFYWDKHALTPCGLLNCGNSCFANVVLQCLACTRPLVAYLLEGSHSRECRRDDWCFLCELQLHIQKVSSRSHPFSPTSILSRLPSISSNLGYGRQEDAHEFMRFAIDTMQSVCLDEYGGEKALDASTQETTLVQHVFGGHLQSQVKCTNCDMVSNRYENMMDLTVEIQGDAESLENCLDQFTAKEWLDGDNKYKCDGCNGYVKAWKRLTIHRAPNILTIALKRFQSGRFGKLNKRVMFPETLDLDPYMSNAGENKNLYSLYAIVVHLDMLNASFFGHYICYTKDFCGQWYRIDDCKVAKVDIEEVLSQGAYMLLYCRSEVRQPMALETAKGSTPAAPFSSHSADNTKESNPMEILSLRMTSIESKSDTTADERMNMDIDTPQASGSARSLMLSEDSPVSHSVDLDKQDSSDRETFLNGGINVTNNVALASQSEELKPSEGTLTSKSLEMESGSGDVAETVAPLKVSVDCGMDMAPEPLFTLSNSLELENTRICNPRDLPSLNTVSDGKSSIPSPSPRSSSSPKKLRPLFTRGFYDRPRKQKPLPLAKEASMERPVSASGVNGSINGFCEPKKLSSEKRKSELQSFTPSSDYIIKNVIPNGVCEDNIADSGSHLSDEVNSSCYGGMETELSLHAGNRLPLNQPSLDIPIEQHQIAKKLGETLENGFDSVASYHGMSHSVPLQSRDERSEDV